MPLETLGKKWQEELFRTLKKMRGWGNGKNGRIIDLYVQEKGMERDYEKLRGAFIEVNGKYEIKH